MRRREDDPRTHPHCDPCQGPARYCCPVSCLGHLEIINASDVLDNAVATVIPDVHAEGEMRLGFHGQVRLDSSWPAGIYTPCCRSASPSPTFANPACPAKPPNRPLEPVGCTRSNTTASECWCAATRLARGFSPATGTTGRDASR